MWIENPGVRMQLFGILLLLVSAAALVAWYFLDWPFIDPFFTSMLLAGSPFYIAMGTLDRMKGRGPTSVPTPT